MTDVFDLLIIGGGPAGLTAGLYAGRARLKTRLLERLSPGGQMLMTDWIDNYPGFPEGVSGFELVDRMRRQAERFDLEIVSEEVTSCKREGDLIRVDTHEESLLTRTMIIAAGATPVKLGVPGEIELTGKGVSYCGTCDGPFYRDVEVAVIGGGDTAAEEAIFLTRFASKVHMFHRRDQLRATGVLREKLEADPNVEIHWSSVLLDVIADEKGMVSGMHYKDLKTGEERKLDCEGVFIFVGQSPSTDFLKGFVELDEKGFVKTDLFMSASQPGVFVAGDCRVKRFRQVATAVGDGAVAAYSAEKYLEDNFGD